MVANASAAVQSKINLKAFEASNSGWAGMYSSIFFPRCIQQYFIGQESVDWVPYFYTCVLILLYICSCSLFTALQLLHINLYIGIPIATAFLRACVSS